MRGVILGVHDGRGVIVGPDDSRYEFALGEWRAPGLPAPGQSVDFMGEGAEARAVFPTPPISSATPPRSESFVLGVVSVVCLALGFIIPLLPTIAAFVVGVIGAARAKIERDEAGLTLSRIGWIGALALLATGLLALAIIVMLFGGAIFASIIAAAHGLGPGDFHAEF